MQSNKLYLAATAVIVLIGLFIFLNSNKTVNKTQESTTKEEVEPTEEVAQPTPKMQIDTKKKYQAILKTSVGDIMVDLYADKTPITVNNFISLAKKGFYKDTIFHRVIKGFMIQGGDPNGNGSGGPGYVFADEPFSGDYKRGIIAMANAGANTNGSQFFIMHEDKTDLPKNYVIFGIVSSGLEVVDKIAVAKVEAQPSGESSKPVIPVVVKSVEIIER